MCPCSFSCVYTVFRRNKVFDVIYLIYFQTCYQSVLVSYGMHSFHTSENNYVYICYIEKQIYNNLQKTHKKTLYRDCISLYISKAVKNFFLKLAYKCIYFLDFYPATRMWTENPVTIKRNAVILTITCVYSSCRYV